MAADDRPQTDADRVEAASAQLQLQLLEACLPYPAAVVQHALARVFISATERAAEADGRWFAAGIGMLDCARRLLAIAAAAPSGETRH